MRVVSLLPSATETLCELGGRDLLVGRSHECDFPRGLEDVPVLEVLHPERFDFGHAGRAWERL